MKKLMIMLTLLLIAPLQAAEGLRTIVSQHSVADTMDKLEAKVTAAGFKVIARVNHGAAAKSVDIALQPIQLLIFGKPKAGSLLMQSNPTVGLDLPMKYLVWQDEKGLVNISWNEPEWLVSRHGVNNRGKIVVKMTGALDKFALAAGQ